MRREGASKAESTKAETPKSRSEDGAQGLRRPTSGEGSLWRSLEQVRGLCAATPTWRRQMGGSFELFASAFLRRREDTAQSLWCEECYCSHTVVTHENGTMVGVCECDPWNCDDMNLTAEDMALWELNWTKLGRAVARAFDCESQETDFALPSMRQIAAFSGAGLPIVLCVAHERDEFRRCVAELTARLRGGFVLLSPTAAFMDAHSKELLGHSRAAFFDLASHVTMLPNGTLRARRSGGELFSPLVAINDDPVEEKEAARIFAVMKSIRSGSKQRKAHMETVFRMLILEGCSQEEVARQLRCSPALISFRVSEIERRFRQPLETLRRFASQLGEMDRVPDDSRARTIHRHRLIDDTARHDSDSF